MLYIAYGSNLNMDQMKYRCPDAQLVGTGVLNNWKLDFHGVDGSAYATITKASGFSVPVAVFHLDVKDEAVMDRYEGVPKSYTKHKVAVWVNGRKHFGVTYIMNPSRRVARPSRKYVNTIRNGYYLFKFDMQIFEDALRRNSVDFYNDNLLEVREFRPVVSYSARKPVKKKPKGKSKKSDMDFAWKGYEWDRDSLDRYFPGVVDESEVHGSARPSLDYYDLYQS